jgi:methanethiol S-methyltransferase
MIWIIFAVLLWGLIHSLLASHKAKELAGRIFGQGVNRIYRLAYNIFSGVSFVAVLAVMFIIPDRRLYDVALPWSIFMIVGELLAVIALAIGLHQTDAWEFLGLRQLGDFEMSSGLTTSGLYRFVRHPLYTAGLVFIWLLPVMTVNILAINLGLTGYIVIGAYFEERKLLSEFGQVYANYMASTPMLIPFLKGNKSRREPS